MRLMLVVLLALGVGCAKCGAARTPEVDVAQRFTLTLQGIAPTAKVTPHDRELTIESADGKQRLELHVDNLVRTCAQSSEACDAVITRAAADAKRVLEAHSAEPTRACVRAVLRAQTTIDGVRKMVAERDAGAGNDIIARPVGGELSSTIVCDMPDGIAMLTRGQQKKLGLDDAALEQLALDNLEAALPAALPKALGASPVMAIAQGDEYAASQALLPGRLAQLEAKVGRPLLFSVPTRDVMLVTAGDDAAHREALAAAGRQVAENNPYTLSPAVFRVVDGGWVEAK